MSNIITNNKAYKWEMKPRYNCSKCNEPECETEYHYPGATKKILVRDCQPETKQRLPKYLLKEMESE